MKERREGEGNRFRCKGKEGEGDGKVAGKMAITLDGLPMKRVLALEEGGTEHLPPYLLISCSTRASAFMFVFGSRKNGWIVSIKDA